MSKRYEVVDADAIAAELVSAGLDVTSVLLADFPDEEDDAVMLGDTLHVSTGPYGMSVVVEDGGIFTFYDCATMRDVVAKAREIAA